MISRKNSHQVAGVAAGENSPDPARNPPPLEVFFQSRFVTDCADVS